MVCKEPPAWGLGLLLWPAVIMWNQGLSYDWET